MKSSYFARRVLNSIIRRLNRRLPFSERIPQVPHIPFEVQPHLEVLVLQYDILIFDGLADWHDNGSERKEEILTQMKKIEREHGEELRRYLAPYKNMHPVAFVGEECCRCRVAREINNR